MKNKSLKDLNKMNKLCCLLIVTMASLFLSSDAFSVAPNINNVGSYYNSTGIGKSDISKPERDNFQIIYSGSYQEFFGLQDLYAAKGTVYYKIGENGDWSSELPNLKSVGYYDIYYYVVGNANYNDLASVSNPTKITVNVVNWGTKVENSGITNYVDPTGKTSAEVDEYGMVWLKEESNGSSAWYGLDNSKGTFKKGSRFWVRWLNNDSEPEDFDIYYDLLDDEHKKLAENDKLWIFLVGVVDLDGNEYTNFIGDIDFYIEIGEDWNKNDINAVFISEEKDEALRVTYIKSFKYPEGNKTFAKLKLSHFSPYAIYEELNNREKLQKDSENVKSKINNNSEMSNSNDITKKPENFTYYSSKASNSNIIANKEENSTDTNKNSKVISNSKISNSNNSAKIGYSICEWWVIFDLILILILGFHIRCVNNIVKKWKTK